MQETTPTPSPTQKPYSNVPVKANQGNPRKPKKTKQNNAVNPRIPFRKPYDGGFLIPPNTEKSLVMVGYAGVLRDTLKRLYKFQLICKDKTYPKQDLLLIAKASDFNDVVKPNCLWRKDVREQKLTAEVGLTKKLDTATHLKPFIGFIKPNGKYREPKNVKVVLRNGLVVSCKMLGQDNWNVMAACTHESKTALVLIFKHAIHSVEKDA